MDIKEQLGAKIKRLRQKQGLTQEQLSEMADISTRALAGIESGKNFMSSQTLEKILGCLRVSLNDLFSVEHLKPTEDLISEIDSILCSIKNDREKVENIYKIIKAIIST